MIRKQNLTPIGILFLLFACGIQSTEAQTFSIPWHTIDSGGGYSSNANFELMGAIGQPDVGPTMSGGAFQSTGGYWLAARPIFSVLPDSFVVTRGTQTGGGIPELSESDNADLSIQRAVSDIQARTELVVKSFSPVVNPTRMELTLEAAVFARSTVDQSIALFNYASSTWVQIDLRPAARFADSVVVAAAAGDLSRFVDQTTGCVEARIRFQSRSQRQNFSSNIDQTTWTIQ